MTGLDDTARKQEVLRQAGDGDSLFSTIALADLIVVPNDSRVAGHGSPAQLMIIEDGRYRRLYERQLSAYRA